MYVTRSYKWTIGILFFPLPYIDKTGGFWSLDCIKYGCKSFYPTPYKIPEQTTYVLKFGFEVPAAKQSV